MKSGSSPPHSYRYPFTSLHSAPTSRKHRSQSADRKHSKPGGIRRPTTKKTPQTLSMRKVYILITNLIMQHRRLARQKSSQPRARARGYNNSSLPAPPFHARTCTHSRNMQTDVRTHELSFFLLIRNTYLHSTRYANRKTPPFLFPRAEKRTLD